MLILAILALVVVGPKDLPKMMRTAGRFVGRVKMMGQEFKDAFTEMGAEEEMAELRREIDELKSMSKLEDEEFEGQMRALDRDLRAETDITDKPPVKSPKKSGKKAGDDG